MSAPRTRLDGEAKLALECLKLAIDATKANGHGPATVNPQADEVVGVARSYFRFVTSTEGDDVTP